jgi:hypothetical protein
MNEGEPLYLYNWDEWFDIARKFDPFMTEDEFGRVWDDFQAAKAQRALS